MPVPVDLSKQSGVIKNGIAKKNVCDKLVAEVKSIDSSAFF